MTFRIVVGDRPTPVRLHLSPPLEDADVATVAAAAGVAIEDGHPILLEVGGCALDHRLARCLSHLARRLPAGGTVALRGADEGVARFLRERRLDSRFQVLDVTPGP